MRFFPLLAANAVLAAAGVFTSASAASAVTDAPDPGRAAAPTWRAYNGWHFRMEDGQLACHSEDGRHCSIAVPPREAASAPSSTLRCDRLPRLGRGPTDPGYQGNGHRRPFHWCNGAYASRFAEWTDHAEAGHALMLSRTPRGDTMCRSLDGVTCLSSRSTHLPLTPGMPEQPVVCGRALERSANVDGYAPDNADHWCQSMEVLRHVGTPDMEVQPDRGTRSFRVALPPWDAGERLAWVVALKAPPAAASRPSATDVRLAIENDKGGQTGLSYSLRAAMITVENDDAHYAFGSHVVADGETFALAISTESGHPHQPAYLLTTGTAQAPLRAIDALRPAGRVPLRARHLGRRAAALVSGPSGPRPWMRITVYDGQLEAGDRIEVLGVTALRRRPPPPPR
ncbi:hypothetical protein PV762_00875 [Mitsuaria sp. CC2]|uniref:hypothetical protein n=1 Tax=Mitsuaria sp. CC2 TaxID=3029186 RepID=UPI003B8BB853